MERCDFSSVMTIVRRFISDDYDTNQTALLEDVFSSLFTQTKETITFDMALVCRWFTGQAKISPKITQFFIPEMAIVKNWQQIWKTMYCFQCMIVLWLHRKYTDC